jgi:hypothetical protein
VHGAAVPRDEPDQPEDPERIVAELLRRVSEDTRTGVVDAADRVEQLVPHDVPRHGVQRHVPPTGGCAHGLVDRGIGRRGLVGRAVGWRNMGWRSVA